MKKSAFRNVLILLLLVAFLARLCVAFYWETRSSKLVQVDEPVASNTEEARFFFGDSDSYWRLGRTIAFGRPYRFDEERRWQIFRTPGYPAILAPLFWIWGENPPTIAARIQGACFGALNVALVVFLTLRLFGSHSRKRKTLALLSGCFVALDPTLILQSVLILSEESFLTFALLQQISALDLARKLGIIPYPSRDVDSFDPLKSQVLWFTPREYSLRRLFGDASLLGVVTACAVYIRPSWLYFLPFEAAILLIARRFFGNAHEIDDFHYSPWANFFLWKKVAFAACCVGVLFFCVMAPWIRRNYELTSRFIPTSLQTGASLYDGLNPNATGASDMSFVDVFREAEKNSPSDSPTVHFEVRLDERMKKAAIDWVKENPCETAKLALVKFYRLWAPIPREPAFSSLGLKIALFVSFTPVFVLGICGFIRSLRRRGAAWFLLAPACYLSILHTIFVSSIRYRTPVLYGFSILASYWLISTFCEQIEHMKEKRQL